MVWRKTTVSLIRLSLLVGALAAAPAASAQPTELFRCLYSDGVLPPCMDIGGSLAFSDCGRIFVRFLGRASYFPLRYVGPIEVEVETMAATYDQFPVYVEIVPLDGVDPHLVCENAPGLVLMTLYPNRSRRDPCDFWETSGIVDLSSFLSIGSHYAIRLYFFRYPGSPGAKSVAVDCIRITSHTVSAVPHLSWGTVKWLYH